MEIRHHCESCTCAGTVVYEATERNAELNRVGMEGICDTCGACYYLAGGQMTVLAIVDRDRGWLAEDA